MITFGEWVKTFNNNLSLENKKSKSRGKYRYQILKKKQERGKQKQKEQNKMEKKEDRNRPNYLNKYIHIKQIKQAGPAICYFHDTHIKQKPKEKGHKIYHENFN